MKSRLWFILILILVMCSLKSDVVCCHLKQVKPGDPRRLVHSTLLEDLMHEIDTIPTILMRRAKCAIFHGVADSSRSLKSGRERWVDTGCPNSRLNPRPMRQRTSLAKVFRLPSRHVIRPRSLAVSFERADRADRDRLCFLDREEGGVRCGSVFSPRYRRLLLPSTWLKGSSSNEVSSSSLPPKLPGEATVNVSSICDLLVVSSCVPSPAVAAATACSPSRHRRYERDAPLSDCRNTTCSCDGCGAAKES
jgi:hypothetical protein